ncbi:hypothetical protein NST54_15660 [Caldifermentibacillus hisashii]|uniref:hypothetical protein n=1 Tax=Caldifermentibacillus hisashii TaxID=996558 RepID=UPI0034D6A1D0
MLVFGDEPESRRRYEVEKAHIWRRDPFSSPFWGEKLHFLTTSPVLVTILGRETPFFGDEPESRRRYEVEKAHIWRRAPFSSPF